jgi:hypothetical protein
MSSKYGFQPDEERKKSEQEKLRSQEEREQKFRSLYATIIEEKSPVIESVLRDFVGTHSHLTLEAHGQGRADYYDGPSYIVSWNIDDKPNSKTAHVGLSFSVKRSTGYLYVISYGVDHLDELCEVLHRETKLSLDLSGQISKGTLAQSPEDAHKEMAPVIKKTWIYKHRVKVERDRKKQSEIDEKNRRQTEIKLKNKQRRLDIKYAIMIGILILLYVVVFGVLG